MSVIFYEFKGDGIDAVALMRWGGTVVKHMTEVSVTHVAENLCPSHEETIFYFCPYSLFRDWGPKARPTGASIELGLRAEQLAAAADTLINPAFLAVVVFS